MNDHERGCEGRNYTCTCGSDEKMQAIVDAAVRVYETYDPYRWQDLGKALKEKDES
ncbi:hypothetical protein LCGC14_2164260 [marine sediment metagenome]|uniref:Uncharacterized protein n=1 Tax=marine sediment metagenome TaxID=412755 RepID=A0A0F9G4L3_9ZZZZ